jgi:hypothetical protein
MRYTLDLSNSKVIHGETLFNVLDNGAQTQAYAKEDVTFSDECEVIGGAFLGGKFRGGVFLGGRFFDGVFWGGEFQGGVFWGGKFRGGEFQGGEFRGGVFRDGKKV